MIHRPPPSPSKNAHFPKSIFFDISDYFKQKKIEIFGIGIFFGFGDEPNSILRVRETNPQSSISDNIENFLGPKIVCTKKNKGQRPRLPHRPPPRFWRPPKNWFSRRFGWFWAKKISCQRLGYWVRFVSKPDIIFFNFSMSKNFLSIYFFCSKSPETLSPRKPILGGH